MLKSIPVLLALGSLASAAEKSPEWFAHDITNAWLQNYDPTLIGRRLGSEFSYEDLADKRSTYKIDTTFRGAYPIAKNIAFGYQLEQTYKWVDTGTDSVSGLGDFECRAGFVGRFSPSLRWGTAMNFEFDTASNSALGANAFQLRPIVAFRWDANDRLGLGMNVEYTFTPSDEGSNDTSALEIKFPVAFKISDQWSAALTYKPRWNFLDDSSRQRMDVGGSYIWGSDHQFALSAGIEVPLTAQDLQFKSMLSLTWYF